jgi:hypothetical protein
MFANRVLKIFGAVCEYVTGAWRKSHNEEPHSLCSLPCIVRMINQMEGSEMVGQVALVGDTRNAYKIEVENLDVKRNIGRTITN